MGYRTLNGTRYLGKIAKKSYFGKNVECQVYFLGNSLARWNISLRAKSYVVMLLADQPVQRLRTISETSGTVLSADHGAGRPKARQ